MREKPLVMRIGFWLSCVLLFAGIFWLFSPILLPFVIGAVLAYFLNPVVSKLQKKGMRRWIAVVLILSGFIIFITAILAVSAPLVARQVSQFADNMPEYSDRIMEKINPYLDWVQDKTGYDVVDEIQSKVEENIGSTLQFSQKIMASLMVGLLAGGRAIIEFVSTLLLVPIVAYFMMKDWPRIVATVDNIVPREWLATVHDLLRKIDRKISGFLRGQILVCFILGGGYAVALTVAGLNYGFLIGIMTGILSVIPYVGSTIGLVSSVGVAALQSHGDPTYIGIIAVIFFMGQFLEGNFITPRLIGDSVGLHPLWIIFALLAGGSLLGLTGMIIAVPVAAIASVLIAFALRQYKDSTYYKAEEIVPERSLIIDPSAPKPVEVVIVKTDAE